MVKVSNLYSAGVAAMIIVGGYCLCWCNSTFAVDDEPLNKGDRILALAVNEAADGNYDNAIAQAQKTGMTTLSIPVQWDQIQKEPGKFSMQPNYLAIANIYYPAINIKLALELNPIDTNNKRLPSDLTDKPYDDPETIRRYKRALDYVLAQIPNLEVITLAIGNEIDGVLHSKQDWAQYTRFFNQVANYARQKRAGMKIGVKGMFFGMTTEYKNRFRILNEAADVVMVTYYPLKADFTMQKPEVVYRDFDTIASVYPDKPIYFMEIGYPSGAGNLSSEEQQAAFIKHAFNAWDQHAEHIRFLEFTWLHDQPKSAIDGFREYYGLSDPAFLSFLSTLGLRTHNGQDKKAFIELKRQANSRGWR